MMSAHPAVAALATASRAAVIVPTGGLRSPPSPCRSASQAGSLYESQVSPAASCQTSAFSGRSMPMRLD